MHAKQTPTASKDGEAQTHDGQSTTVELKGKGGG